MVLTGELNPRSTIRQVHHVLRGEAVGIDEVEAAQRHLERGPEGAEPTPQLGLVLHRGGVHPSLDGLLDEIRDGLGREVGLVLQLGGLHPSECCTSDPGFLGIRVRLRPREDFLDQGFVLFIGQQLLDAQVRTDLVEHHRQFRPVGDVTGDEERVALGVDPALRALGVLGVERAVLHRLVGGLVHRDLAPTHRGGDVVDGRADGLDRGAFGVGGAGESVAVAQTRRNGVDRGGYFFSCVGWVLAFSASVFLNSLSSCSRSGLNGLRFGDVLVCDFTENPHELLVGQCAILRGDPRFDPLHLDLSRQVSERLIAFVRHQVIVRRGIFEVNGLQR